MYHIGNQKYRKLEGSRAEVWHHTAHHTSGGLKRSALKQNEEGRIVSRAKSKLGKSQKHLGSHLQKKVETLINIERVEEEQEVGGKVPSRGLKSVP